MIGRGNKGRNKLLMGIVFLKGQYYIVHQMTYITR